MTGEPHLLNIIFALTRAKLRQLMPELPRLLAVVLTCGGRSDRARCEGQSLRSSCSE